MKFILINYIHFNKDVHRITFSYDTFYKIVITEVEYKSYVERHNIFEICNCSIMSHLQKI